MLQELQKFTLTILQMTETQVLLIIFTILNIVFLILVIKLWLLYRDVQLDKYNQIVSETNKIKDTYTRLSELNNEQPKENISFNDAMKEIKRLKLNLNEL